MLAHKPGATQTNLEDIATGDVADAVHRSQRRHGPAGHYLLGLHVALAHRVHERERDTCMRSGHQ